MLEKLVPGTVIPYSGIKGSMFELFRPMIKATDGLQLGQVCTICGLEISTVQNWVKRGFVPHPVKKKYYERHLARILIISSVRDSMKIEDIATLLKSVNGDTESESDDIISEPQLYDYLCETIRRMDIHEAFGNGTEKLIHDVISDYRTNKNENRQKIVLALLTMVFAYASGRLKQESDMYFNRIRGV